MPEKTIEYFNFVIKEMNNQMQIALITMDANV